MNIRAEETVREVQEQLKRAEAAAAGLRAVRDPAGSPDELAGYTESVFRDRLRLIKGLRKQAPSEQSDTGYDALNLRKKSVTRYAAANEAKLRDRYPQINVAEELIKLNAPCGTETFSELNDACHIELAAAIYILDELKRGGKLDDALPYLPENRDQLDRAAMPDIADSVHPDDLIRGMLYAVHYRNGSDDPMLLSGRPADPDSDGRRNYDAILALVGEDSVSSARAQVTEAIDRLAERTLDEIAEYKRDIKALAEEDIRACEAYLSLGGGAIEPQASPLAPDEAADILREAMAALAEVRRTGEALDNKLYELEAYYLSAQGAVPSDSDIHFADAYEACLGFVSLLDSGSDCIHIYNLPYRVMARACADLPWATGSAGSDDHEREDMNIAPEFIEAAKRDPEKYIRPYSDSILSRRIVKQPFTDSADERISFAQLVYMTSGMLPPRGLPELSYIKALLEDSGLSVSEIDILYEYLTLAYYIARRDEDYIFIDEDEEESPAADREESPDTEQLREMKREIKALKAMINKLEHRVRKSSEALQIADDNLNRANSELAELRSMIRKADKTAEDQVVTVDFPYTVRKRTVVFGGHDSWSKAIRPLLNDVRFVEPSAQPNPMMIRNAEVVWIQTNAMSHANFYKIVDIVRKHDIELRYFKYASAEKCAEQLALEDEELSGGDE